MYITESERSKRLALERVDRELVIVGLYLLIIAKVPTANGISYWVQEAVTSQTLNLSHAGSTDEDIAAAWGQWMAYDRKEDRRRIRLIQGLNTEKAIAIQVAIFQQKTANF